MKTSKPQGYRVAGEILKIVEIEATRNDEGNIAPLSFRVEFIRVTGRSKLVTARVWRKEFYRIRPTFPQKLGKPSIPPSDEVLLVEETSIFGDTSLLSGRTVAAVLRQILCALDRQMTIP
jgi:hypothetical protein